MSSRTLMSALRGAFLISALAAVLFPLTWVTLASFKTPQQLNDPSLIVFQPSLINWSYVFEAGILQAAGRSAFVAGITVLISAIVGSLPPT